MLIAVFGRSASGANIKALNSICNIMDESDLQVIVYKPFWEEIEEKNYSISCNYELFSDFESIDQRVDYIFSIGGDGTLLNTVDFVLGTKIPVIGINTGRLGFLAHYTVDQVEDVIEAIRNNDFDHDYRQLLEVSCNKPIFDAPQHALNEFTIQKKDPSAVIKVHVYLDDEFLSTYWADGVIVSTATGSTGYSLSAGGPIIIPQSNSFVITPIAAHNLNQRPIIIPNTSSLKLKIGEHRGQSYCTLDSKYWQIQEDFEFEIKKSNFVIDILRPQNMNFTDTLRNKLMWGIDNRNK